jgi:recombination DNA repair RAD52 pathway protein
MFSDEQKRELEAPLSRDAVKVREGKFSYIEAWHGIAEANRIFAFDWSSETIETHCVVERERMIGKQATPGWSVTYTAKVRVTAGGVFHDGCGAGHGIGSDVGLAHESALKEAESDARKRAMMQFGNQFGLALYDREQHNVADGTDEVEASRKRFIDECVASIERIGAYPDPNDLLRWWNSDPERKKRRDFDLTAPQVLMLKNLVTEKVKR